MWTSVEEKVSLLDLESRPRHTPVSFPVLRATRQREEGKAWSVKTTTALEKEPSWKSNA